MLMTLRGDAPVRCSRSDMIDGLRLMQRLAWIGHFAPPRSFLIRSVLNCCTSTTFTADYFHIPVAVRFTHDYGPIEAIPSFPSIYARRSRLPTTTNCSTAAVKARSPSAATCSHRSTQ